MKKFTLVLGLMLSASVVSFGQKTLQPASIGKSNAVIMPNRAGELDCPVNSIFSQPPVNVVNAYFSDQSTNWSNQRMFENFYGLTSPIGGITFWGILYNGGNCYSGGSDNFVVTLYQDNAGAVGSQVLSFPIALTPTVTGSFVSDSPLLRYDLALPSSVTLTSGWLMIYRENPSNTTCAFAWATTIAGDGLLGFNQSGGPINYFNDNVAFCLQGGVPDVPISNWALFIGLGMILVFTVIRFRKTI